MIPSLLLKALPYLLAALLAGYAVHRWDQGSYERLQATFSDYKAQDAIEAGKAAAAIQKQHEVDVQNAEGAINGLKSELEALRSSSPAPIHARLCQYATHNSVSSPGETSAPSGTGATPSATGSIPDVSTGVTIGPDIGAQLLLLAQAADILSAEDRARLSYLRSITQ